MAKNSAPILAMFLGSLPRATFLEKHWGQRSLWSSSQALLDLQVFGLQDFVNIVAFLRPHDGRLRLVQDGTERWKGGFDQEHVFPLLTNGLSRGMTVGLERLDLFWPPVVELCGGLAAELGCPVHANAYLTPAGAPGLRPHYDTHDVFVLQLEGEKSWSLGQIEYALPTERTADGVVTEMRTQTHFSSWSTRGRCNRCSSAGHHQPRVGTGSMTRSRSFERPWISRASAARASSR